MNLKAVEIEDDIEKYEEDENSFSDDVSLTENDEDNEIEQEMDELEPLAYLYSVIKAECSASVPSKTNNFIKALKTSKSFRQSLASCPKDVMEDLKDKITAALSIVDFENITSVCHKDTDIPYTSKDLQNTQSFLQGIITPSNIESAVKLVSCIEIEKNGFSVYSAYHKMSVTTYTKKMRSLKKHLVKNRRAWRKAARKRKHFHKRMKPMVKKKAKASRRRGRHTKRGMFSA